MRHIQDLVATTLPAVIAKRHAAGRPLPWIVERDLTMFLTCGEPLGGHAVLACLTCRVEKKIVFTCKRRSLCPRCINRRREDRTPHLVNKVLRDVPYRHWVLCLPAELRYNLGRYPRLTTQVLARFVRAIFSLLRRKALRRDPSLSDAILHPVALSVRHRVSADLTPNIHFHCLVPEGVYVERRRDGPVEFFKVRPPTREEIEEVAVDTCRRTRRLLKRRGYWTDLPRQRGDRAIRAVRGTISLREDRPVTLYGRAVRRNDDSPRHPGADSFDVFAASRVEEGDRAGRENLVRYLLAPPFQVAQLTIHTNRDVSLQLKRPQHAGTTEVRFTDYEFVEALLSLVHHPRSHAIGYHGGLARNARIRKLVVPGKRTRHFQQIPGNADDAATPVEREAWKQLHARAHRQDFRTCLNCSDRLVLVKLVGNNLRYQNARWVAPDTPKQLAGVPLGDGINGKPRTWDSRWDALESSFRTQKDDAQKSFFRT